MGFKITEKGGRTYSDIKENFRCHYCHATNPEEWYYHTGLKRLMCLKCAVNIASTKISTSNEDHMELIDEVIVIDEHEGNGSK